MVLTICLLIMSYFFCKCGLYLTEVINSLKVELKRVKLYCPVLVLETHSVADFSFRIE